MNGDMQEPKLQPGTTASSPVSLRSRRPKKVLFIASAAILVIALFSIGFIVVQQNGGLSSMLVNRGQVY